VISQRFSVSAADPCSPEVSGLIRALSDELSRRYGFADDGSGGFLPEDVSVPRSAFVIGSAEGRPVACGAIRPLEPDVAEIKRMFVLPEFRGRGYSKAVLVELERLASGMGYRAVRLETGDRQPEAIALYEGAGYSRIPNFGAYSQSGRSVCFEKRLADG
jgi:GNAT superfamily N-acetyltransferase